MSKTEEIKNRLEQQDAMIELLLEWVGYLGNLTPDELFDGVEQFAKTNAALDKILNRGE